MMMTLCSLVVKTRGFAYSDGSGYGGKYHFTCSLYLFVVNYRGLIVPDDGDYKRFSCQTSLLNSGLTGFSG